MRFSTRKNPARAEKRIAAARTFVSVHFYRLPGKIKNNMRWLTLILLSAALAFGQKYTGPKPPKPDLPYLVHADNRVPTEVSESKPETKHNDVMYTVPGTSSPARTPLAEPIFLMESDKI